MKKTLLTTLIFTTTHILGSTTCVRVGNGAVAPLHEKKLSEHGVQTVGTIDIKFNESLETQFITAAALKPTFWDVCTPPEVHLETLKKIIELDPMANIICEKPICMSSQVEELNAILKDFKGKLVVNENYLSSDVTAKVQVIAFQQLKPTRIVIEMDKNRTQDFLKGRYVDPEGAFKYEGTHIVTILQSVLDELGIQLPEAPVRKIYTDLSSKFPSQGSADIGFEIEGLKIDLYSGMDGSIKNSYPPHGRGPIQESETAPRYRVIAIEGTTPEGTQKTVAGFYEPLAGKARSIGEVVVIENNSVIHSESVADDTMGKHLHAAVDYFKDETNTKPNPCPVEKGIEIVKILDSVLPTKGE